MFAMVGENWGSKRVMVMKAVEVLLGVACSLV